MYCISMIVNFYIMSFKEHDNKEKLVFLAEILCNFLCDFMQFFKNIFMYIFFGIKKIPLFLWC